MAPRGAGNPWAPDGLKHVTTTKSHYSWPLIRTANSEYASATVDAGALDAVHFVTWGQRPCLWPDSKN